MTAFNVSASCRFSLILVEQLRVKKEYSTTNLGTGTLGDAICQAKNADVSKNLLESASCNNILCWPESIDPYVIMSTTSPTISTHRLSTFMSIIDDAGLFKINSAAPITWPRSSFAVMTEGSKGTCGVSRKYTM